MPLPSEVISRKFKFSPTDDQILFFKALDPLLKPGGSRKTLILSGYAGTGKTTIVSALVETLPLFNFKYMLLAPTGRAAKVINHYTGRAAFTVHKVMFKQVASLEQGVLEFKIQKNYSKNTVYIIDEASMLSAQSEYGKPSILAQIISYIFDKGSNRMIIIGDSAQLPPVGQDESHSLDINFLKKNFDLEVEQVVLRQVIRQAEGSGILHNATQLRSNLSEQAPSIGLTTAGFKDVYRMTGERLEDGLRYAYEKYGQENTMIVCRSNRTAVQYNRYIRQQIFYYDSEIEAGDYLMIAKNNYFYLDKDSSAGFLANGDFVEVLKIKNFEDMHGLRFADMEVRLLDYPDEPFEVKIILDSLYAEAPALPFEQSRKLYESVESDHGHLETPKERKAMIRKDPYLNALHVKFAYALTCHKSQGGQWDAVFVDQGYLPDDMLNKDYIRWLYTAVTRAAKELFFLNFHSKFFIS